MIPRLRQHGFGLFACGAVLPFLALAGCQNVPTHKDIMYYNRQHELMAAREMAVLREKLANAEITEETYNVEAQAISDRIHEEAMDSLYRDYLISTRAAPPPPQR